MHVGDDFYFDNRGRMLIRDVKEEGIEVANEEELGKIKLDDLVNQLKKVNNENVWKILVKYFKGDTETAIEILTYNGVSFHYHGYESMIEHLCKNQKKIHKALSLAETINSGLIKYNVLIIITKYVLNVEENEELLKRTKQLFRDKEDYDRYLHGKLDDTIGTKTYTFIPGDIDGLPDIEYNQPFSKEKDDLAVKILNALSTECKPLARQKISKWYQNAGLTSS